jgi:transposase-like protein
MAEKKLTKELIKKAHGYISQGHYAIVVCSYLGISEATYYKWIQKAKEDQQNEKQSIYVEFFESVKEAEAIAEMKHIENIKQASDEGTWQASAWYLERKHKDRWSNKQEVQLSGNPEQPLVIKTAWNE